MGADGIGAAVRRKEDVRFLTGRGTYTDDIARPGQTHAHILRSGQAHARIRSIDVSKAKAAPGVVAVFTGADMAADGVGGLPCGWLVKNKDGSPMKEPAHPPLVVDRVRHVGDQIAVVIAETRAQAKDAAELIEIDFEPLPAVVDSKDALKHGAPQVHGDVVDPAPHRPHQLRLRMRRQLVVQPAQHALGGAGVVVLDEARLDARRTREGRLVEALEEPAAVVGEDRRPQEQHLGNR